MWPYWGHEGSNALRYFPAQNSYFSEYGLRGGKRDGRRAWRP